MIDMFSRPKRVVVFGGAHGSEDHNQLAYDTGWAMAKAGFTIITGGGPGMMEEVRRGVVEAGGYSYGVCINFYKERERTLMTAYEDHQTFTERHNALISYGQAFVVLPGGLGTVVEALTITQLKKFREVPMTVPLIFVGTFYDDLVSFMVKLKQTGFIGEDIRELYTVATTPTDVTSALAGYFSEK